MKSLFYSVAVVFLLVTANSCISNGQFGIRGEGSVVERKFNLDPIEGIYLPGSAKLYLTQGSDQEVRIQGQENIIDNLNLEVTGKIWEIDNKRSVWQSEPVKIYITLKTLKRIRISGSGDVRFENTFTDQRDLEIRISGSGNLDLDIEARDINASISGSGDLHMRGEADYVDCSITGSGSVDAYDLLARKAEARISGSGGMELSVEDRLDAHITGSGNIYYKGHPRVNSSISGSGSVRER